MAEITKQWYEKNPELLDAEKAAMRGFLGDKAELVFLSNGTASWRIHYCPELLKQNVCKRGKCERVYEIAVLYEDYFPNAPKEWPSTRVYSSKAFFLRPSIKELQMIVNERYSIDHTIPHILLHSGMHELYPCGCGSYIEPLFDVDFECASAVESTKNAFNWISAFENGMVDPHIWHLFTRLGPGI